MISQEKRSLEQLEIDFWKDGLFEEMRKRINESILSLKISYLFLWQFLIYL